LGKAAGGGTAVPPAAQAAAGEKTAFSAEETRGVWMWSSDVRQEGAEAAAERLSRYHINKVYFLVKGLSGRVCYPSKLVPAGRSDRDELKEILEACHKRHIEVHAWFIFHSDGVWARSHPEDVMCLAGKRGAWDQGPQPAKDAQTAHICPLSEDYRAHFKGLIQEVLDRYPVDGIHLDCIRYTDMLYCFCPRHQALAATNGIDVAKVREAIYKTLYSPKKNSEYYFDLYRAGDRDVTGWVHMREGEIDRMVKEVRALVKTKSPSLVLSAAFMPEGGELDDAYALCHYAQNYATAGSLLDYILPMSYHKTYGKSPAWVAQIAQNAGQKSHRPVYSGIQAYGKDSPGMEREAKDNAGRAMPKNLSPQELRETILAVEKQGIKGFVLFRYGSLTDQMWEDLPL
jgi:uncharacterized lipoprotein YddW (UPF0748 family)